MDQNMLQGLSSGTISLNPDETKLVVRMLEDNLRKAQAASTMGYQTGATVVGADNGGMSPLLPQSIDPTLASLTMDQNELVFWKALPKGTASQTLHEYTRRTRHGSLVQDHNVAEGGAGSNSTSVYDRKSVRIKFWSVRREITDVAAGLTGLAPASNLLTEHTNEASFDLLRSIEMDCLFGDSELLATKPDGVIKQILDTHSSDTPTYEDVAGEQVTMDRLSYQLRKLAQPNKHRGAISPTVLMTTHAVWNDLERQEQAGGRYDKTKDREFVFGAEALFVRGPKGRVPIIAVPFLDDQALLGLPYADALSPDAGTAPATPTAGGGGAGISAAGTSGKFTVNDSGAYYYKVVAHNGAGHSQAFQLGPITPTAGQSVSIKLDTPGTLVPSYYRVYRSPKGGAAADCTYLFSAKYATGGGLVVITDDNSTRPNTGRVLFMTMDEQHLQFYKLLPMARIPLAKISLTTPFAIFMSGAPAVKLPEKFFIMKNVGVGTAL